MELAQDLKLHLIHIKQRNSTLLTRHDFISSFHFYPFPNYRYGPGYFHIEMLPGNFSFLKQLLDLTRSNTNLLFLKIPTQYFRLEST